MKAVEKIPVGFVYTVEIIGKDGKVKSSEAIHNLMPDVGRDYFLNAALTGGSAYSTWYIGLFGNDYTPVAASTMSTIIDEAGEVTAYDSTTRIKLEPDALDSGVYSNSETKAEFLATGDMTVRGGFITSGSAQGGSTGLLLSAVLFTSPKVLEEGETLNVIAGLALATS
jgi:hypothetical protein